MTPSAWRDGGRGETIRYVIADSPLGPLLIAATAQGHLPSDLRRGRSALHRRFPNARIEADDGTIADWVDGALKAIERPPKRPKSRSTSAAPPSRKRCGASCARSRSAKREATPTLPLRSGSPAQCAQSAPPMVEPGIRAGPVPPGDPVGRDARGLWRRPAQQDEAAQCRGREPRSAGTAARRISACASACSARHSGARGTAYG